MRARAHRRRHRSGRLPSRKRAAKPKYCNRVVRVACQFCRFYLHRLRACTTIFCLKKTRKNVKVAVHDYNTTIYVRNEFLRARLCENTR